MKVPKDVTRTNVDSSVTIIKEKAFSWCELLVSVVMGDNVLLHAQRKVVPRKMQA